MGTILMVEDNPDDEALTLRAFRKSGIKEEVVVARDGVEALDFLFGQGAYAGRDTSEPPRLILLDLKLPKLDGVEVLQRIRDEESTRLLPVVILTSSREPQDVMRCYSLYANSYIRKPVDFDQFLQTVQQIANYWLVLNEFPVR
jgi:CheY-like chemotaxis protein